MKIQKILVLVGLGLIAQPAWGANLASDVASDAAYDDGWQTGDNGGSGFDPWNLIAADENMDSAINAGFFISTSTENGDGDTNTDGDIDTTGEAFGIFANTGDASLALRPFTGGALGVGQTFSIDIDNGFIDDGSAVGFALLTSTTDFFTSVAVNFGFNGGQTNYAVVDGDGVKDTLIPFTDEGLTISVTLLGGNMYSLSANSIPVASGSLTTSDEIIAVAMANLNAGNGAAHNTYFNSLSITGGVIPEPASAGLGALGALVGLVVRMRRRS